MVEIYWSLVVIVDTVLEIQFERVRRIADLAEMDELSYFAKPSHFGATGRPCGEDHFSRRRNNPFSFSCAKQTVNGQRDRAVIHL